jgi:hypothetical protein
MKINSTHKNLNTSYVNLSALLKFLRRQNFIGRVHFETRGYEADIFFNKGNEIKMRENDHIAGRISVGDEILPQILIRAHEPDGIINVYDEAEADQPLMEDDSLEAAGELFAPQTVQTFAEPQAEGTLEISFPETREEKESAQQTGEKSKPVSLKERLGLPNLPFSFRKKGLKKSKEKPKKPEEKAIEKPAEENFLRDWNELLVLIGEILQTVEKSLADANLNFIWVFDKVRAEVFEEYPFLHPNSTVFEYKNGRVSMTEQINNNLFIAGVVESLGRLLEKFETHPKFAEVHRSVIKNILELMNKRHAQYDKFLISQQLERILET